MSEIFELEGEVIPNDWLDTPPEQELPESSDTAYRIHPAINQSFLKTIYWNPGVSKFVDDKYAPKHYFSIGGAVDCLLTTNEFYNKYYVSLTATPSDSLIKIVNYLLINELDWVDENLLAARDALELFTTYTSDGALKTIGKAKGYYDERLANRHKVALSQLQMDVVEAIIHSFKTNARTKKYFTPPQEGVEHYHQLQVYFEHGGVPLKGMLDLVVVDFNKRTVEPFDIKTTGKAVRAFSTSVQPFGYHIQAVQYSLGLQYGAEGKAVFKIGNEVLDLNIIGFEIKDFKFIVQTTDPRYLLNGNVSQPQIFQLDPALLVEGRFGKIAQMPPHNCDMSPSTTVNDVLMVKNPGLEQMLDAYKFQKGLEEANDPDAWVLTQREIKDYKKHGAVLIS